MRLVRPPGRRLNDPGRVSCAALPPTVGRSPVLGSEQSTTRRGRSRSVFGPRQPTFGLTRRISRERKVNDAPNDHRLGRPLTPAGRRLGPADLTPRELPPPSVPP